MRFRFPIRYRELLDQWKYQLLQTVSRLVCKCVRQFGDRIGRISCQEVRHVNFVDCSVYRTLEPRSICGHGQNIYHNLLLYEDIIRGIITKSPNIFNGIIFFASHYIKWYFHSSVFTQGPVSCLISLFNSSGVSVARFRHVITVYRKSNNKWQVCNDTNVVPNFVNIWQAHLNFQWDHPNTQIAHVISWRDDKQ